MSLAAASRGGLPTYRRPEALSTRSGLFGPVSQGFSAMRWYVLRPLRSSANRPCRRSDAPTLSSPATFRPFTETPPWVSRRRASPFDAARPVRTSRLTRSIPASSSDLGHLASSAPLGRRPRAPRAVLTWGHLRRAPPRRRLPPGRRRLRGPSPSPSRPAAAGPAAARAPRGGRPSPPRSPTRAAG